jgi:hypothetical protein
MADLLMYSYVQFWNCQNCNCKLQICFGKTRSEVSFRYIKRGMLQSSLKVEGEIQILNCTITIGFCQKNCKRIMMFCSFIQVFYQTDGATVPGVTRTDPALHHCE